MVSQKLGKMAVIGISILALSACGGGSGLGSGGGNIFRGPVSERTKEAEQQALKQNPRTRTSSVFDLFDQRDDPNTTVEVNRFIWQASLDVLNFLPIQSVDPFSGVIVTGFGTPPGGGRAYRATIYVQDPALDARSLNVALQTRGGPAPAETVRSVEDAILTRARQLRIAAGRL